MCIGGPGYNVNMSLFADSRLSRKRARLPLFLAIVVTVTTGGCKKLQPTDMTPLDQAGMRSEDVEQLRQAKLTEQEIREVALVRHSGLTDKACLELVSIAHGRKQPFTDGDKIAGLAGAGFREDSVLELARMSQFASFAGEAQVMRLAGLSDAIVLTVARRRAAGQPVLSGDKVAALQNSGLTHAEILTLVNRGATDSEADQIMERRNYAAGGHSFVHQVGRRR